MNDTFNIVYTFVDTYNYSYQQNDEQWTETGVWHFPFMPGTLANDLFLSLMNSEYGRQLYAQHGLVQTISVSIVTHSATEEILIVE